MTPTKIAPIVCNLAQGSEDWLLWREMGIGSSDAPAIMGVSPWTTAYQLWELKTGRRQPRASTAAMQRGTALEADARREFEFEHGGDYPPACLIHPEHAFLKASLDGWNPALSAVVEIKCPGRVDHQAALEGRIPDKYVPQVQHLLMVSGADRCWYVSYEPEGGCVTIDVPRDELYIARLQSAETIFWGYVERDEAPPQSEADVTVREDEDWIGAAREYQRAKMYLVEGEAWEKRAREALIALAAGQRCAGEGVRVTPYERAGSVDYKAAGIELADILGEPVDWDKWRRPSTTEIRITQEKAR